MSEPVRSNSPHRSTLRIAAGAIVVTALAIAAALYAVHVAEDQNDAAARQARERFAELCISRLLRVTFGATSNPEAAARHAKGFAWIEALDPRDLELYCYSAGIGVARWRDAREIEQLLHASGEEPGPAVYDFILQRDAIEGYSARYGIRWGDSSTPEDRTLGIAAGVLAVLDLKSGELIGRRTGYTLASRAGGGARATCPSLVSAAPPGTAHRDFLLALLH